MIKTEPKDNKTFTITVTMKSRWVPHFLSFLKRMESDGNIGHSEILGFYADGDGDFRPKFDIESSITYDKQSPAFIVTQQPNDENINGIEVPIFDVG